MKFSAISVLAVLAATAVALPLENKEGAHVERTPDAEMEASVDQGTC